MGVFHIVKTAVFGSQPKQPKPRPASSHVTATTSFTSKPSKKRISTEQRDDKNTGADNSVISQNSQEEISNLRRDLQAAQAARDQAERMLQEERSSLTALRQTNEKMAKDRKEETQTLLKAKSDVLKLSSQALECQNELRISKFRESEAVLFLKQLRRFYKTLLKNMEEHGSGDIAEILNSSDVPTQQEIHDIDKALYSCGLLEEKEFNDGSYMEWTLEPSPEALGRSAVAAAARDPPQDHCDYDHDHEDGKTEISQQPTIIDTTPPSKPPSHQKSYKQQPSQREQHQLASDLRRMTQKCIQLQLALKEEKTKVQYLSRTPATFRRRRSSANNPQQLQKDLDQKTHDVYLVICKLNELNTMNKVHLQQIKHRDEHIQQIRGCLTDLQTTNQKLMEDRLETEVKLRKGVESLQSVVDAIMAKPFCSLTKCCETRQRLTNRLLRTSLV